MKNIKIRARWFNIGSLLTMAFFFYMMSDMEKQKQMDVIIKDDELKDFANYQHNYQKDKTNA
jgi:hypothetical protein